MFKVLLSLVFIISLSNDVLAQGRPHGGGMGHGGGGMGRPSHGGGGGGGWGRPSGPVGHPGNGGGRGRPSGPVIINRPPMNRPPVVIGRPPMNRPPVIIGRPPMGRPNRPGPGWGHPPVVIGRPPMGRPGWRPFPHGPIFNPIPHRPFPTPVRVSRWGTPRDYYRFVNRNYIYRRWVFWPWSGYANGYGMYDNYPYYVYNGYRHRYDPVEQCHYQLVDGTGNVLIRDYINACSAAYDQCATERDNYNRQVNEERYFCAEAVDQDQENSEEYSEQPVPQAPVPQTRPQPAPSTNPIEDYLSGRSYKDIFDDAKAGNLGACQFYELSGNEYGCNYIVTVNDEYFPDAEGDTCSRHAEAAQCNVGDEEDNTGCLLAKAVQEGRCF